MISPQETCAAPMFLLSGFEGRPLRFFLLVRRFVREVKYVRLWVPETLRGLEIGRETFCFKG